MTGKSSTIAAVALLLSLLFCPASPLVAEYIHHVVIVTSSDSIYETKVATGIQQGLNSEGTRAVIIPAENIDKSHQNARTLFIAIGVHAINRLRDFDRNAIVLRISSKQVPSMKYSSVQSDLLTSQSVCRHIQLIKSLNRDWDPVAFLSSVASIDTAAALTKCTIRKNINLQVYAISDQSDLLATLETAVENNKVLLATSDPLIYNTRTVKNILLTAYRHRKPVIGYSDSFVQAGAIAAVYTPPVAVSEKALEIVGGFFNNNWQFNRKVYRVEEFSISLNKQVATSLDIKLPDKQSIRDAIERAETLQ